MQNRWVIPKWRRHFLLSISGVADVIGRFCTGFIAHFHLVPTNVLMAIFAILSVISSILTPFVTDFIPLSLMTFAFTINAGAITALKSSGTSRKFLVHIKLASHHGNYWYLHGSRNLSRIPCIR